ncbi:MAG: nucleoside-diphosphate kinase [Thaumarchaeota archaeon]|nr:nucleoside-diphosphate kinase [Nitrososphaerota archaeon]NSL77422.1 nucleoside-diphosphate kinase [Nitrososphaerota archaeon]PXF24037.1 MAG: nucleoside-diphosphate kinase [Nitrososphaerota archaeon]HIM82470.1 nucleoside-diphosphate kinase [Nitrososphaerales archaeon]
MTDKTLILIKPDGVKKRHIGDIISRFEERGFNILHVRMLTMNSDQASNFYSIHKEKPFFSELIDYITSGPIVQVVLEGNSAIEVVRQMVGATNSLKAASGTIRGDFGLSHTENVIHASDSVDSFEREFNILSNI